MFLSQSRLGSSFWGINLPAAEKTADLRAQVRALAERLDSQTLEAVRKEMLALAGAAG